MLAKIQQITFVVIRKHKFYTIFFFAVILFSFTTPFTLAQDSIADLITRIKPSVVKIVVYDEQGKQFATGSGFFISQTKVMTNKHVIEGGKRVEIKLFDDSVIYASKIQNVPDVDIAILEFKPNSNNIKPLSMATSLPREGDKIVVFGSPLGLQGSISDGIVSTIRNTTNGNYIQITAPISPGSSGSPVVNMSGRVVGIATLNIKGGQNLNFAIPAQEVAAFWVNQISGEIVAANKPAKQEVEKQPGVDLTGNWKSLMNTDRYQIIDGEKNLSITRFVYSSKYNYDAKWVGDAVIGYYHYYFIIKGIDSEKVGFWWGARLKPTDSDEKILRTLTKKTKNKPDDIWKRTP